MFGAIEAKEQSRGVLMNQGVRTYSGVVHVHTDQCGGATFESILNAARECGVDYIVLTDRNPTHSYRELAGWHDGVLVILGEEICCADGEFLAFETRSFVGECSVAEIGIEQVRRANGAVVGMNYQLDNGNARKSFPQPLPMEEIDMVELWSFLDEFLMRVPGNRALLFQARPARALEGPTNHTLRAWDKALAHRFIPAIGAVNAFLRKDPLLDWREFFPFRVSFNTIRTMIVCPELPSSAKLARQLVWKALRGGHSFIYNHFLGNPREFLFQYVDRHGCIYRIGDTVEYSSGGFLDIVLPQDTEVRIRRNGEPLFWGTAENFSFPVPAPGVYRVEVLLDRRMWILTNPIRILEDVSCITSPSTIGDLT